MTHRDGYTLGFVVTKGGILGMRGREGSIVRGAGVE